MPAGDDSFQPSSAVGPQKASAAASAVAGLKEARSVYLRFVSAIEDDGRYPLEAYRFLQEGLEYAVRRTHGPSAFEQPAVSSIASDPRHVDGGQLCLSLRELALARWGPLARTVLNAWGVHSTRDFGEMVFVLVANEFLHKTEQDTLSDFEHVFAFGEIEQLYQVPFLPLHQTDFEYSAESCLTASHGGGPA